MITFEKFKSLPSWDDSWFWVTKLSAILIMPYHYFVHKKDFKLLMYRWTKMVWSFFFFTFLRQLIWRYNGAVICELLASSCYPGFRCIIAHVCAARGRRGVLVLSAHATAGAHAALGMGIRCITFLGSLEWLRQQDPLSPWAAALSFFSSWAAALMRPTSSCCCWWAEYAARVRLDRLCGHARSGGLVCRVQLSAV